MLSIADLFDGDTHGWLVSCWGEINSLASRLGPSDPTPPSNEALGHPPFPFRLSFMHSAVVFAIISQLLAKHLQYSNLL